MNKKEIIVKELLQSTLYIPRFVAIYQNRKGFGSSHAEAVGNLVFGWKEYTITIGQEDK